MNGLRRYRIIGLVLMPLLLAANTVALDLNGYYKNFVAVYDLPRYSLIGFDFDTPPMGQVTSRLRLNGQIALGTAASFSVAWDIVPRIQDRMLWRDNLLFSGTEGSAYRAFDFDRRIYPEPDDSVASFGLFHNLDRAVLSISARNFDLYLGRQAIAWGSARAVNPTDVIAPYAYTELDTEDRVGVDGVRLRVPLGFMGEIDAGYLFGDDFEFEQSAFFLRGKTYLWRTDLSAMVVGFRENLMVGVDLARAVGGAGVWLEAGYVFDHALDDRCSNGSDDYLRMSLGLDYSLTGRVYGFVEYHFNESGGDAGEYFSRLTTTAYRDGGVYLMGRHYLIPGISWQITPLISGGGELLVNLGEPSALIAPNVEYNLAEDIYLSVGAFIGIGRRPGLELSEPFTFENLRLRSEFGSYPNIYHTSFRVYF